MNLIKLFNISCRRQSPTYHFFVANSTGLKIENINIKSTSDNDNPAKNTDGIGEFTPLFVKGLQLTGPRPLQIRQCSASELGTSASTLLN